MLFFRELLKERPLFHWNSAFPLTNDVSSAKEWQEREIVPKTIGSALHDARQTLVPSVVRYFGVLAAAPGALLSLFKPCPEVRSHVSALGTGQVIFVLNFYAKHCIYF